MELHQSAREQFEKVAASIRATLTAAPDRSPPAAEPSWQPDIHAPEITDADIFRLRVEGADGIRVGSKLLPRAAADELRRLSERLARALQSKAFVGPRAVFRHAQEWVFSSVKESFCEFCLARLGTEVRERTVWVPVACLHVESEFDIGPVRFRAISSADIDRWCEFRDAPPEARPFAEGERAKLKTEIQGYAAGTVNVVSDLDLADAIALDLVRDALAALRLFSPAADGLRARSYCVPHGMEHIERYLTVKETAQGFEYLTRGLMDSQMQSWSLPTNAIQKILGAGLAHLGAILGKESHTDLEDRILTSVRLFGDSTLEGRLETRLVMVLAAMEGVFLKDTSEAIQQNLGERLALITYRDPDRRLSAVRLVKHAYGRRSRFVHHSQALEHDPELDEFVRVARHGLLTAAKNTDRFKSTAEFIEAIDRKKMSS